jgi:hypothetical protein
MGKSKYRTVVAAVLAGVVLFSPLMCGMTCLDGHGIRPSAVVESAPRAEDLAAEFVGSALVGCVLSHLVSKIDFSEWADQVDVVTWVWVGVEVLRMSDEAWRGQVLWR